MLTIPTSILTAKTNGGAGTWPLMEGLEKVVFFSGRRKRRLEDKKKRREKPSRTITTTTITDAVDRWVKKARVYGNSAIL